MPTCKALPTIAAKLDPVFSSLPFPALKRTARVTRGTAAEKGTLAIVADRPSPRHGNIPWIHVQHGREALALAARNFYEKPDERVHLTGVTGTNGKTTSSSLIDAILRAAGKTTALIGTIEYHLAGQVLPAVNTTPESLDLFRMFEELAQAGGTNATPESLFTRAAAGAYLRHAFSTRRHLPISPVTIWTITELWTPILPAKQLLFTPRIGPPPDSRC